MDEEKLAKILRVISTNKWRILILLHLIKNKEAYVGDIAEAINITSFANASKNLNILEKHNLVRSHKKFVRNYYSINTEKFPKNLLNFLKSYL